VLELRPLPLPPRRFMGARRLPADLPVEPVGNLSSMAEQTNHPRASRGSTGERTGRSAFTDLTT
jgi:hypothetical protein